VTGGRGQGGGEVGSGVVRDAANKTQNRHHTGRLARARDLLAAAFDVSECVLACYSAAGFHDDLRSDAGRRLALVTLDDIYRR
jgi:uncharacterized protein